MHDYLMCNYYTTMIEISLEKQENYGKYLIRFDKSKGEAIKASLCV